MTDTILPHELPEALARHEGASVLSLDCFDTLLWRDTHAPAGVFEALPGATTGQRVRGEAKARKAAGVKRASSEVAIGEIYAHVMPNATETTRGKAIASELAAEAAHCFAFAPTVELMRRAKVAGKRIVIVSDTYLDKRQLRDLIAASAGADVAAMIDRVFCSSSLGVSKSQGMLAKVVKALGCKPADMLHIGDNRTADFDGARALGIPALHLVQFSNEMQRRLRFEQAMAKMCGGDPRIVQPHRAALAAGEPTIDDPARAMGFGVLGPVFHAYRLWVGEQADALQEAHGGRVHKLFLMRDGHLPRAMQQAADPDGPAHAIELSRFTATAASLTTNAAIERHVELELGLNPETLARQLLFTEDEIAALVGPEDWQASSRRLLAESRKGSRRKIIRKRAGEMAQRLIEHIRSTVDPAPGDTLMLIDLGYNGSAQNWVDALLRETLGVHVAGRYLLCREMDAPGLDKSGMIDGGNCDPHLLEALCENVAVLEQLSTTAMGSCVGYSETGEPVRTQSGVKARQSDVRERVQAGCLAFADAADSASIRAGASVPTANWRQAATACLARLLYLPLPGELDVLRAFEHDVNTGSDRMVPLFDPELAGEAIRRRGLFYMKGSERMFLPAELAGEDIATRLSLFAQKRFGLKLTYDDSAPAGIALPVMHIAGADASQSRIEARATHDGWQVLRLPIGAGQYSVAVQFGAKLDWVQVQSVTAAPLASLSGEPGVPVPLAPILDDMEQTAPHIFQCQSETGLMLVNPPKSQTDEPLMVEIVFRPLVERRGSAIVAPSLSQGEAA